MPATGECCVCGKEAFLVCGACAKENVNLAFCSKEHQQLVWFAHKPICGPGKARLDPPPALDKVEKEWYQSNIFKFKYLLPDYQQVDPTKSSTLTVERMLELPPGAFQKNMSSVDSWIEGADWRTRLLILRYIRESLHKVLATEPGLSPLALPAHAFATVLFNSFNGADVYEAHPLPLGGILELLHRGAIFAGLLRILDGRAPNLDGVATPALACSNLQRLLQTFLEYIDTRPGGNLERILAIRSREAEHVPAMKGFGIRIRVRDAMELPWRASEVLVTGPGEVVQAEAALSVLVSATGKGDGGSYVVIL